MKQPKKLSIDTILKQQEAIMRKLQNELIDLQFAVEDKKVQIALQQKVLDEIKGAS